MFIEPCKTFEHELKKLSLNVSNFPMSQPPRFDDNETADRVATPGVSVGLVWTTFGGEVQFVETTSMVGKGDLHLTGQLGDVIKESAQIALTWVNSLTALVRLQLICDRCSLC